VPKKFEENPLFGSGLIKRGTPAYDTGWKLDVECKRS
jgi:hypothetical protein